MDFGEVVIANQTGALTRRVPTGPRGQFTLLDQHDVGLAFLGEMVCERHPHDAAAHNDDPSLRIRRHSLPPLIMPVRLPWDFESRQWKSLLGAPSVSPPFGTGEPRQHGGLNPTPTTTGSVADGSW